MEPAPFSPLPHFTYKECSVQPPCSVLLLFAMNKCKGTQHPLLLFIAKQSQHPLLPLFIENRSPASLYRSPTSLEIIHFKPQRHGAGSLHAVVSKRKGNWGHMASLPIHSPCSSTRGWVCMHVSPEVAFGVIQAVLANLLPLLQHIIIALMPTTMTLP